MTTRLAKWGNSLGLRLPKAIIDQLNLSHGSEIEIVQKDERIIIIPKDRDLTLDELIHDMRYHLGKF